MVKREDNFVKEMFNSAIIWVSHPDLPVVSRFPTLGILSGINFVEKHQHHHLYRLTLIGASFKVALCPNSRMISTCWVLLELDSTLFRSLIFDPEIVISESGQSG